MKRIFKQLFPVYASALLLSTPANLSAIPAYPGKMTVRQADGTKLSIQLIGDEYGHMAMTADGYPLLFNRSEERR